MMTFTLDFRLDSAGRQPVSNAECRLEVKLRPQTNFQYRADQKQGYPG